MKQHTILPFLLVCVLLLAFSGCGNAPAETSNTSNTSETSTETTADNSTTSMSSPEVTTTAWPEGVQMPRYTEDETLYNGENGISYKVDFGNEQEYADFIARYPDMSLWRYGRYMASCFLDENTGWAVYFTTIATGKQYEDVLKTNDGGETWLLLNSAQYYLYRDGESIVRDSGKGITLCVGEIRFLGPNFGIVLDSDVWMWGSSGPQYFAYTTDGGCTWTMFDQSELPFILKDFYDGFSPCSLTAEAYADNGFIITLAYLRDGTGNHTVTMRLDFGGVYEIAFDEPITVVTRKSSW